MWFVWSFGTHFCVTIKLPDRPLEKSHGGINMEYASKGVANAGLTTDIIGTALGALNGGLFNFGGWNGAGNGAMYGG